MNKKKLIANGWILIGMSGLLAISFVVADGSSFSSTDRLEYFRRLYELPMDEILLATGGRKNAKQSIDRLREDVFRDRIYDFVEAAEKNGVALVRQGDALCDQEVAARKSRLVLGGEAIADFLGLDAQPLLEDVPRIAICASGGGVRSSISTLGSLIGFQQIGLLDAVTYVSALSGSSWLIASLFLDARTDVFSDPYALQRFKKKLIKQLEQGIGYSFDPLSAWHITQNLLRKIYYGQDISVVDFWGFIIGEMMLRNIGQYWHKAVISDQSFFTNVGSVPIPLYTMITPFGNSKFGWFEVSPYEVWTADGAMGVPTWSFGRKFKNGRSKDFAHELALCYFLGIFGSAFEVDLNDFIRQMGDLITNKIARTIIEILLSTPVKDLRLNPAEVCNYMYKHPLAPLARAQQLTFIDAGIDFNLPLPPLLRKERDIDVIIVLDNSAGLKDAPELQRAITYAKKHRCEMPNISFVGLEKKNIWVFDDNPKAPIIVYVPLVKNEQYDSFFDPEVCVQDGFCGTFTLEYTQEQTELLCGLTHATIVDNHVIFKKVLRLAMERRKHKQRI
jgi:phospholipase A2